MAQDEEFDVGAILSRVDRTEALALDIVLPHIAGFAPFIGAPEKVADRLLPDFGRMAATNVISKHELLDLASRDIKRYVRVLRTQVTLYPQINASRLAVLAHVAMVIGLEPLKDCRELWETISDKRWEDAADVLLMTQWPVKAVTDDDRRRVLELARMMRNGTPPLGLTQ